MHNLSVNFIFCLLGKSIVLEDDLENVISEDYDKIKEEALQMTMNELKESKIVLEGMEESITSANENGS